MITDRGAPVDVALESDVERAVALQVLGSGGPMHAEGRGSAAYLLWVDQRPAVVVDMGGDTPTALARAGVRACEVDTLLLTHFHPDHISGLPDFLWGEMVAERNRPLTIVGPDGNEDIPDLTTMLRRLFGSRGAFAEMASLFGESGFRLQARVVSTAQRRAHVVLRDDVLRVSAFPVSHGRVPTLSYRVEAGGASIVFASDQTLRDKGFVRFARETDLLVMHAMATCEAASDQLARVVALPGDLAMTAADTKAKRVLLGHLMGNSHDAALAQKWSLTSLEAVRSRVAAAATSASVELAYDQACYPL